MEIIRYRDFEPDYRNLVKAASNQWVDRVPLYEHIIGEKVIFETTGTRPYSLMFSKDPSESREGFRQYWNFWKTMGYDTASMEFCICDILYSMGGGALGAHKEGCIKDRDDFERFPWEEIPVRFFEKFGPAMKTLAETCPQGMKAVGGVGNGIFECVQDLVGYMDLCFLRSDDEELYADLFKKMGDIQTAIWEKFLRVFRRLLRAAFWRRPGLQHHDAAAHRGREGSHSAPVPPHHRSGTQHRPPLPAPFLRQPVRCV